MEQNKQFCYILLTFIYKQILIQKNYISTAFDNALIKFSFGTL